MMNFDELKQILELVRAHELTEFEIERDGLKLRIKKNGTVTLAPSPVPDPGDRTGAVGASPGAAIVAADNRSAAATSAGSVEPDEIELAVVKSPIVGTFYRSPEPDSSPFVNVGDRVKKSQVLCIIEAMKLMNGIESEYDGEVVSIYVENGQPVQYGERLFAIRTD